MLSGYRQGIRAALATRRQVQPVHVGWFAVGMTIVVLAYLGMSILLTPVEEPLHFNFQDESGTVTAFSALCLGAATCAALLSIAMLRGISFRDQVFWLIMALGMGFLAFDELLSFHEKFGKKMDRTETFHMEFLGEGVAEFVESFRGWNDILICLYGVAAIGLMLMFLPSILRHPRLPLLMGIAFVLYATHTAIDTLTDPRTTFSMIMEECAKALCSAYLALSMSVAALNNMLYRLKLAEQAGAGTAAAPADAAAVVIEPDGADGVAA